MNEKAVDYKKESMGQVKKCSIADIFGITNQDLKPPLELHIHKIKNLANDLWNYLEYIEYYDTQHIGVSKFKLQECVMWAVKGVCNSD